MVRSAPWRLEPRGRAHRPAISNWIPAQGRDDIVHVVGTALTHPPLVTLGLDPRALHFGTPHSRKRTNTLGSSPRVTSGGGNTVPCFPSTPIHKSLHPSQPNTLRPHGEVRALASLEPRGRAHQTSLTPMSFRRKPESSFTTPPRNWIPAQGRDDTGDGDELVHTKTPANSLNDKANKKLIPAPSSIPHTLPIPARHCAVATNSRCGKYRGAWGRPGSRVDADHRPDAGLDRGTSMAGRRDQALVCPTRKGGCSMRARKVPA